METLNDENKRSSGLVGRVIAAATTLATGFVPATTADTAPARRSTVPARTAANYLTLDSVVKRTRLGVPKRKALAMDNLRTMMGIDPKSLPRYLGSIVKSVGGRIDESGSYDVFKHVRTKNDFKVKYKGKILKPDLALRRHYLTFEYCAVLNAMAHRSVNNKQLTNAQVGYFMDVNSWVAYGKRINRSDLLILRESSRTTNRRGQVTVNTTHLDNGGRIIDILYKKSRLPRGLPASPSSMQSVTIGGVTYVHLPTLRKFAMPWSLYKGTASSTTTTQPRVRPRPGGMTPPRPGTRPRPGTGGMGTMGGGMPRPRPRPMGMGDDMGSGMGSGTSMRPSMRRAYQGMDPNPPGMTPGSMTPTSTTRPVDIGVGASVTRYSDFTVPSARVEVGGNTGNLTVGGYIEMGAIPGPSSTEAGDRRTNPSDPRGRYSETETATSRLLGLGSFGAYVKYKVASWFRVKASAGITVAGEETTERSALQFYLNDGTPDGVAEPGATDRSVRFSVGGQAGLGGCFILDRDQKYGEICAEGVVGGDRNGVNGGGRLMYNLRF
ncbi:hypothetical protein ACFL0V_05555 [Nanoarchaeota archaeon]